MITTSNNKIRRGIIGLILIGLMVSLTACNQQTPFESGNTNDAATLGKTGGMASFECIYTGDDTRLTGDSYPQSNFMAVEYFRPRKTYQAGFMNLPNGSKFEIAMGALIPPHGTRKGAPVEITMTCERDSVNNELLFTYGPHGSQFSPPAKLTLSWKDLNIEIPTLYYVDENGNYIEQQPDDIDVTGKWLVISVHHFSRYALAWSR